MRSHSLSVAVIGGGIGGLSAGSSLLEAGLDVHLYDQSRRISEVGARVAVSPNATRILYRLDLDMSWHGRASAPPPGWQRRCERGE